jgi:hypothetical protein
VDVHVKNSIGALKTIAVGKQLHLKIIRDICFSHRIPAGTLSAVPGQLPLPPADGPCHF